MLDSSLLDQSFRSPFLHTLIKVSRKTGLYPNGLLQTGAILQGEMAVAAGNSCDIWKGTYNGQVVAIKVPRSYETADPRKTLKVSLYHQSHSPAVLIQIQQNTSNEALVWRQLRHKNILPFLCLCHLDASRDPANSLVIPWMQNGNIQEYLRKSPEADRVSLVRIYRFEISSIALVCLDSRCRRRTQVPPHNATKHCSCRSQGCKSNAVCNFIAKILITSTY